MRMWVPLLLFITACSATDSNTIKVACAANLQEAMDSVVNSYEQEHGLEIELVSDASGILFTQIQQGAPFDIFISANKGYPLQLEKEGLASSPQVLANAQLMLYFPAEMNKTTTKNELLLDSRIQKIAIPDPAVAPIGEAALNYIQTLDGEGQIKKKLVTAGSVAQANLYLDTKAVDAGFSGNAYMIHSAKQNHYNYLNLSEDVTGVPQYITVIRNDKQHMRSEVEDFMKYLRSSEALDILLYFGYTKP